MRKSRFNAEQIIGMLKEPEAGEPTTKLCRQHGIAAQTLYRWEGKYGGMEVSEARRLRAREEENGQLKHTVAELLLDKRRVAGAGCKNMVSPQLRPVVLPATTTRTATTTKVSGS